MKIKEMLDRRTDLSTFVVHLTRRTGESSARANLKSILRQRCMRAVSAMGAASEFFDHGTPEWDSQRVVSFTESPLEQLHSFFVEFDETRRHGFEPYGLAFTKLQARRTGVNPVWYLDVTWGTPWRVKFVWNLVKERKASGNFLGSDIAEIAPFVETMGYVRSAPHKEFWWEREWRHLGDFQFTYGGLGARALPRGSDRGVRVLHGAPRKEPSVGVRSPVRGSEVGPRADHRNTSGSSSL
jgi:hypothetical protein